MDRKKSQGSSTYISQNRVQNKGQKKRHRSTLHSSQGKNPSRRKKKCKHICTPHRSTKIHNKNIGGYPERYRLQHLYTRGFNTPRLIMDRYSKQNINKDIAALNNALDQMDLINICMELFIPKRQNTHSFQMHMEHFQRQTTEQASTNSRKLKSFPVFSQTISV